MSDPRVICDISMVCESTGREYDLKGVELDEDTYVRSTDQSLQNMMIIEFLKQYPNINLGVDFGYSITAPNRVAERKESYEDLNH